MISSMTGYGCGASGSDSRRYVVEIRSENNRFLEISVRLPKALTSLEPRIKNCVQDSLSRGRIYVSLSVDGTSESEQRLVVDDEVVRSYYDALSAIKERFGLRGEITLDIVTRFPNILTFEVLEENIDKEWSFIEPAVRKALTSLMEMRKAEGAQVQVDLEKRVDILEDFITKVEAEAPKGVALAREKLEERLRFILGVAEIDPLRLAVEAGIIAERCDVTEECVRFHSHNHLFKDTLKAGGPIGKRLNFLLQEMNREANTIGSKGYNTIISHCVVQMKEEIEKLREQVQNIE